MDAGARSLYLSSDLFLLYSRNYFLIPNKVFFFLPLFIFDVNIVVLLFLLF